MKDNLKKLIEEGDIKKGNIQGVLYKPLPIHSDDSGWLMEISKEGELFIPIKQTTLTMAHPGYIKAFHYHKNQTDLWFGSVGRAKTILKDIREDSPTKDEMDIVYIGQPDYNLLLIPKGVAHGYQVLGPDNFFLFYHTDKSYNPENPDENRIQWDEWGKEIWEIKNR